MRNAGDETMPNVAVTRQRPQLPQRAPPGLADPERPLFAVNGVPSEIGGFPEAKDATPLGCDTAYVNTWACGRSSPGAEKTFVWTVTAVKAGPYEIAWRVAAGLDGKAQGGRRGRRRSAPSGTFTGTISDEAPDVRIADDGKTVVSGTR